MRTHCGSCQKSGFLEPILDLGKTPLADAFPDSPDAEEKWYPLGLVVCRNCWLVQNSYVVPDDELYNADYGFYTGASPSSVAYFANYAEWAIKRFQPKFVVEIASNDGTLLERFAPTAEVLGVEPSDNVAMVAAGKDIQTLVAPFGRAAAKAISSLHGKPDLIIANNVIAHVSDLDDFVGGIADLLADDGHVVIEFQYLGNLLLGNQFDHVYHEHRSFFSLTTLENVLLRHGLWTADYLGTPAQGGSMRVVAGDVKGRVTGRLWRQDESELMTMSPYTDLQRRADDIRTRLYDLVWEQRGNLVGYGATAKSTTLLNFCNLDPYDLRYVADLTPYKQGRFTPGTKIPIRAPDPDFDGTYLLLAWNYMSGVLRRERDFLDRGGRFIVPIPVPVLL